MEGQKIDNVNHPSHYEKSCSIECIEAMEAMFGPQVVYNFCICNAYKYIWRHKFKNGLEDLEKAKWYLNYAFDLKEDYEDEERWNRLNNLLRIKRKQWTDSH